MRGGLLRLLLAASLWRQSSVASSFTSLFAMPSTVFEMFISIFSLIYRSPAYADSVYDSLHEFTPTLRPGSGALQAQFKFIANDPEPQLLAHLEANYRSWEYIIHRNPPPRSPQWLAERGIAKPEYLHRVYRGWNRAVLEAGERDIVVLVNSDHIFSPGWLEALVDGLTPLDIHCSQVAEPPDRPFPGSYTVACGNHPSNFNKDRWLQFVAEKKAAVAPGSKRVGGEFMPCAFYRASAIAAGLYPPGNVAAITRHGFNYERVGEYGDADFFKRFCRMFGAEHVSCLESLVWHANEGEDRDGR